MDDVWFIERFWLELSARSDSKAAEELRQKIKATCYELDHRIIRNVIHQVTARLATIIDLKGQRFLGGNFEKDMQLPNLLGSP